MRTNTKYTDICSAVRRRLGRGEEINKHAEKTYNTIVNDPTALVRTGVHRNKLHDITIFTCKRRRRENVFDSADNLNISIKGRMFYACHWRAIKFNLIFFFSLRLLFSIHTTKRYTSTHYYYPLNSLTVYHINYHCEALPPTNIISSAEKRREGGFLFERVFENFVFFDYNDQSTS